MFQSFCNANYSCSVCMYVCSLRAIKNVTCLSGWGGKCGNNEVTCHLSGYGPQGKITFDWLNYCIDTNTVYNRCMNGRQLIIICAISSIIFNCVCEYGIIHTYIHIYILRLGSIFLTKTTTSGSSEKRFELNWSSSNLISTKNK